MKSIAITAAALAALAVPAMAAEQPAGQAALDAHRAELDLTADQLQAHKLLLSQGYTVISSLEPVSNGRWIGTALKNGKTLIVGVNLPKPRPVAISN
jgi:hypothetical protein